MIIYRAVVRAPYEKEVIREEFFVSEAVAKEETDKWTLMSDFDRVFVEPVEVHEEAKCEYTLSHTRYWCGNTRCRES